MNLNVRLKEGYTEEDANLFEAAANAEARQYFWAFRQRMNPGMLLGWFQWEVACALQLFYEDLIAGLRPKLALVAPPQHGKSSQIVEFIAWVVGKHPELLTIYASYSADLGVKANLQLQRMLDDPKYFAIFPDGARLAAAGTHGTWLRNTSLLEFVHTGGNFQNVTVDGQITGKGLGLGVIDDPIKGRNEAESEVVRNKTWTWFTDDFFTRFSENAGLLIIMTRWHMDDPMGRFLAQFPETRHIVFKAIATQDEEYRRKGEPLFPELKSLEFLMERKTLLTDYSWQALYQGAPILAGGLMIKRHWFEVVGAAPADCYWVRWWDLAATVDGGAYTAGCLMGRSRSTKMFYIKDVKRAQLGGDDVRKLIKQVSAIDLMELGQRNYQVWFPKDPGQSGKVQSTDLVTMLAGYDAHAEAETGSKETRAEPFAAQAEAGNVKLVKGIWIPTFLDEAAQFPAGKYKDQVDAASGAFGALILHPKQSIRMQTVRGMI